MWLRSEIKNEEVKIKELDKKIDEIEMKTELAEVEWSYITQSKNIELLNNKFLKLEPIPIVDIENYKEKTMLVSNNEN
tara:strand:+ start:399 stop:632 length:234 start_codon:yes stop_codon:yes gene_type:complete